jgi:hypothetical protein
MWSNVNPIKHFYGSELYYDSIFYGTFTCLDFYNMLSTERYMNVPHSSHSSEVTHNPKVYYSNNYTATPSLLKLY